MKLLLLISMFMLSACEMYDPEKCPEIELKNLEREFTSEDRQLIYAAKISCSFQKRCVKSIDFETMSSECYGFMELP